MGAAERHQANAGNKTLMVKRCMDAIDLGTGDSSPTGWLGDASNMQDSCGHYSMRSICRLCSKYGETASLGAGLRLPCAKLGMS